MQAHNIEAVKITASARLHLGFLDLNGGLGRKFGGLGLSISGIATEIVVSRADKVTATGPSANRAEEYARIILDNYIIDQGAHIAINRAIPEHIGLGSGTQLSLAVGTAITRLFDKPVSIQEMAKSFHRGARSGIGIGVFSSGGFIIDGGRNETTGIPPVIIRIPFPEEWRIILVFDQELQGLNGMPEQQAFIELPKMPEVISGAICRSVLMQLLPALYEKNCNRFGESVSFIQQTIGDHFARVQGGRFCSPYMQDILNMMHGFSASGTGQSSWGSTGFAFFANDTLAFRALRQLRNDWAHEKRIRFLLCRGNNASADSKSYENIQQLDNELTEPSNLLTGKQK